jgi:hypothetical protein
MNDSESNYSETNHANQSTQQKLHSETALMHWADLQKFFAQGKILYVDNSLDLVEMAVLFADDLADELAPHLLSELIVQPSNQLAKRWYDAKVELWTVVVAPYVLVQQQQA